MLKLGNPAKELNLAYATALGFFKAIPAWARERWRRRSWSQLEWIVSAVGFTAGAVWFVALLLAHMKIIVQPGPQEFNEPAIWHATWLLDHGRNPYTINELPGTAYCFGPLYNYVVMAFSPLLGIGYPAHRMVVLVFLFGAMWIMFQSIRKAGAGAGIAMLAVVFYYWMSLNNIEITARPDSLGLFLFLLGMLVPWERGYTLGWTILGLLCAVVAYNCKSYFVLAGCATLLGHFLVRDRRQACWLGVGFFTLVGLTFAISCYLFPYLYIETVIVQRVAAVINSTDEISLMHSTMLVQRGWPFMLAMLAGVGGWFWGKRRPVRMDAAARREEMRFISIGLVFLIFLSIVYYYMGRHAGAYFTYHLHLLMPLMMVLAAYALKARWQRIGFGVFLLFFCRAWVTVPEVDNSSIAFNRMERLIFETHADVLGIASVTDVFERDNRHVMHNGNTMFMGFAFADNRAARDKKVEALALKFQEMEVEVKAKIEAKTYGLVLTEFDQPYFATPELLQKYYDKVEQIDYFTYFGHSPVRVWRPKPNLPPK